MIRVLHRWPGLLALALITILALSGAALSIFPVIESLASPQAKPELNVAELADRVQAMYPGVEQIRRAPSGRITAYWFVGNAPGAALIDPSTGQGVASADPNQTQRWLTNLHRSLLLDDAGRIASAIGAAAMLFLSLSGAALVARRAGGWRRWCSRLRGPVTGRLHVEFARISVAGLLLSSMTALWMTASTFELLPEGRATPALQIDVSGKTGLPVTEMGPLRQTPVAELRDLSFPDRRDGMDVFTLKTDRGTGVIDQGTGALLAWSDLSAMERISETIYMLHTGQGAAALGLVLGLMALCVPVMGCTGVIMWLSGLRARPTIKGNIAASRANTILLVGSEGGSTWGFAATVHEALTTAGHKVHAAPMSTFNPARYAKAQRYLILASTYGDGDAPASARGFLHRLARLDAVPAAPIAVLGFGERSFPAYCAFAERVASEAGAKGWATLIPFETVDRQSPQDFARWGRSLGAAMGCALELSYQPMLPASKPLKLISRRDYGAEVQAPTAILRFALPQASLWRRLTGRGVQCFEAGDLLGIVPEGVSFPRFYSLASGSHDGFIEIVVKKQHGGLCSGHLMELKPGDRVSAFIRRNPRFHVAKDDAPLILIGAGTGVGPLAGFVRDNVLRRPIHLFFGMRHPDSDFLYRQDLACWQVEGRLARLVTAISRGAKPNYVQDALRNDAAHVAWLIGKGARVMVCGGREMATGVADALADILAPTGLTPATLKAEGRYVEDVY